MATYRITSVPVYVGGKLYDSPADVGREIDAIEGLAGKALAPVVQRAADAPAEPEGRKPRAEKPKEV